MIASVTVALFLIVPAVANHPTCPDWRALAGEGETKGFFDTPAAEVAAAFRRAAEAAECSNEPVEVSDRLWLRVGDWLSNDHPDKALALIQQRLQLIRAERGRRHPREAPYLWLEADILSHEKRELGRAERAVKKALQVMWEAYGDPSPEVAAAHRRLALFYQGAGRDDAALAVIDRAVQAAERSGRAGRGELYEALVVKYYILDALRARPAERERVAQRKKALWDELQAEGWKPD